MWCQGGVCCYIWFGSPLPCFGYIRQAVPLRSYNCFVWRMWHNPGCFSIKRISEFASDRLKQVRTSCPVKRILHLGSAFDGRRHNRIVEDLPCPCEVFCFHSWQAGMTTGQWVRVPAAAWLKQTTQLFVRWPCWIQGDKESRGGSSHFLNLSGSKVFLFQVLMLSVLLPVMKSVCPIPVSITSPFLYNHPPPAPGLQSRGIRQERNKSNFSVLIETHYIPHLGLLGSCPALYSTKRLLFSRAMALSVQKRIQVSDLN